MELSIRIFLGALACYVTCGVLFGLYFLFFGAVKIDPLLKESKKAVRLLLLPGIIATWPIFIRKLIKQKKIK